MAFAGKLLGALIGSVAGPLGTIIGGFIGHLFDRAAEERRLLGVTQGPTFAPEGDFGRTADPVSQAQVNFLTCLIGLSITVADADGHVKVSHVEAMKEFFRRNFPFPSVDQELIQRLIDEMYRNRDKIDVQGLCAYYAALSTFEGRILLLRLMFQIALADAEGISRTEGELIRRIALLLGLGEQVFRQVRAEFVRESGRAWEILGITPQASVEEIKAAYRQLTLQNHPDKVANLGPEFVKVAEEKFKAIQEAYEEIRREKGF
jgi:DnaJ like chaperone protein